jgi:hypothetical protein
MMAPMTVTLLLPFQLFLIPRLAGSLAAYDSAVNSFVNSCHFGNL